AGQVPDPHPVAGDQQPGEVSNAGGDEEAAAVAGEAVEGSCGQVREVWSQALLVAKLTSPSGRGSPAGHRKCQPGEATARAPARRTRTTPGAARPAGRAPRCDSE